MLVQKNKLLYSLNTILDAITVALSVLNSIGKTFCEINVSGNRRHHSLSICRIYNPECCSEISHTLQNPLQISECEADVIGREVVQIKMLTINKAFLEVGSIIWANKSYVISRKMKPDIFISCVSTERQKSDSGFSKGKSLSY